MNEELLAALKEWAEACKVWDEVEDETLVDAHIPSGEEMRRCNEAAKRLRALAMLLR